MNVNPAEFGYLLDPPQIEKLLISVVDIVPQALFVLDTQGNVLARATSIEVPTDFVDRLSLLADPKA